MSDKDIKKLIPLYLEGELEDAQNKAVRRAMASDPELKRYADELQASWDLLGDVQDIEPSANYVSNFWTRLSMETSWVQKVFEAVGIRGYNGRVAAVFGCACVILLVGVLTVKPFLTSPPTSVETLVALVDDDLEMLEHIELVEYLDLFEEIEFLEEMDLIDEMDTMDISRAT